MNDKRKLKIGDAVRIELDADKAVAVIVGPFMQAVSHYLACIMPLLHSLPDDAKDEGLDAVAEFFELMVEHLDEGVFRDLSQFDSGGYDA